VSINCGHCKGRHEAVGEVRACAGLQNVPDALGNRAEVPGELRNAVSPGAFKIQPTALRPDAPEITEGMWKLGDRIIKIQIAHHGSGRLYGKELMLGRVREYRSEGPVDVVTHHWERLVGAVRILREQGGRKMTLEEAIQFGRLYGFCCRCGTILTDENSIEAGIGPVCAEKFT
jgi:hypothetical protein